MAALNDLKRNSVTTDVLAQTLDAFKKEISPSPVSNIFHSPMALITDENATAVSSDLNLPPPFAPIVPNAPSFSQVASPSPSTGSGGGGGDRGGGSGGVGGADGGGGNTSTAIQPAAA